MAQQYQELSEKLQQFISEQKLFFVATADVAGRINVSPKGMDSLRVLDSRRLIWLNVTGSGNETAAHVQVNPRMTLMFCAFTGSPMILRLYGQARVVHHKDADWDHLVKCFPAFISARQIFDLEIEMVQTSCGMAVPFYDYVGEREQLNDWAQKKGSDGIRQYWLDKNQTSIDGLPTHIRQKNL